MMRREASLQLIVDEEITLRLPKAEDAEPFFNVIRSNRDYLRRYLNWADWYKEVKQVRHFFQQVHEGYQNRRRYSPLIVYRGALVGMVSLFDVDPLNDKAEIGYWLARAYTGKGIMTRAARRLLRFGFRRLQLNRIALLVAVDNQPSIAVAKRLGFTFEGVLRQSKKLHGRYVDMALYSLLAAEFTQADRAE